MFANNRAFSKFSKYQLKAEQGNAGAQFNLAACYQNGIGVQKNPIKTVEWLTKAADNGHTTAQYKLGMFYQDGVSVKKDPIKAVEWLTKAANKDDANAQLNLAVRYLNGIDVQKDLIKAVEWYTKAANKDDANAQFGLGLCYANGFGVKKDESKAVEWYTKAANKGNAYAQCNLGVYYINGTGIDKNEIEAYKWFKKSAEQGIVQAQYGLARRYQEGVGIEKNLNEAFKWYKIAADKGYADAQFQLGYMLYMVYKIENQGLNYIQMAANQGHVRSQHWINKKIAVDPKVILEKVEKSKECYIPKNFPKLFNQIGPYCGSAAFAGGCNYAQLLPEPLYASFYEKKEAGKNLDEKNEDVVLEQLKSTRCPTKGPQFSIHSFQDLAGFYKIKDYTAAIVLEENCTEEEYRKTLCTAIRDNNVLILACDHLDSMPKSDEGKSTHWVLGFGYWRDENNDYKIAVVHQGIYCEWSIHDLYESNQKLPKDNPHVKNGSLNEFRFSLFKMKVKNDRDMQDTSLCLPNVKCVINI